MLRGSTRKNRGKTAMKIPGVRRIFEFSFKITTSVLTEHVSASGCVYNAPGRAHGSFNVRRDTKPESRQEFKHDFAAGTFVFEM